VRIGIRTDRARKIRILEEGCKPQGDASARPAAVSADQILYNDLSLSGVFSITRAWSKDEQPFDVQAVVEPRVTLRGSRLTVTGEIKDFPARRPIGKSEYQGSLSDLRRLVHRLADDVVYQLTGERGIAETQIAFVAGGPRQKDLYVVDYDGYGPRQLSQGGIALSPGWSPDGGRVAFSWLGSKGWSLYAIPATGGKVQTLRAGSLNIAPAYSPDGSSIAFASSFEGNTEIYVMPAAGGAPRRLTTNRGIDTSPTWAPSGAQLAFTSDRGGSAQVYVMDADGANLRRLIYDFSYTDSPDWSPKGDRISFVVRSGAGFDIYVADADGRNPRLIVTGGANENPRWSPDGRHLVFSSTRDGGRGLFITDAEGLSIQKLKVPGPEAKSPAWSPRPRSAATAVGMR
jgi:TolB protein